MEFADGVKKKKPSGWLNFLLIIFSVITCLTATVCIADASKTAEKVRSKIGLVLSGGGARGAAHIGVIKVLEEMNIPIDYIAGTSMGSIVGGLYASGMTVADIENIVTSLDWSEALLDNIPRASRSFRRKTDDKNYLIKSKPGLSDNLKIKFPSGLRQGQNIDLLLKELTLPVSQIKNFDDFKIPFRAVATNIVTGEAVILGSGDLATAMRASMSVPAIFSTVEIDGNLLVDGGVSNNLPVNVVREMGADIVIAIDISTPLRTREELDSTLSVTGQLTGILTRRNTEKQIAALTEKDIFIVPVLGDITSGEFDRAAEAIPIGKAAAEQKKQILSVLTVPEAVYAEVQASQKIRLLKRQTSTPVIEFIRLENNSRLSDKVIFSRLQVQRGDPLDVPKLEENISQIYGLELFENISYEIIEENGQTGLVVQIKERSWGPNYIQAGISLVGNQDGDNFYNLELSYTRTAINRFNGEWRTVAQFGKSPGIYSEIYQPISYNSSYFIHPRIIYRKNTVKLYSDRGNDELADYRLTQYGADIAVGREFGTWGEARIGVRRLSGDAEISIGQPIWPDYSFDRGEVYAKLSADKLDNLDFPRDGYSGFIEYIRSEKKIGADSNFDQVRIEANIAVSWKKNSLIAGTKISTSIDDNAPLQNRFGLGGLFNLSGYSDKQLYGQQLGLFRLAYMRRINDFNLLPTYIGASFESGNVWDKTSDMEFDSLIFAGSIFLGVDTPLGPIYIGYGKAEGSQDSVYFYLGEKIF